MYIKRCLRKALIDDIVFIEDSPKDRVYGASIEFARDMYENILSMYRPFV